MERVVHCSAFGWKYVKGEYVDQPKWFIELLTRKILFDQEFSEKKTKT